MVAWRERRGELMEVGKSRVRLVWLECDASMAGGGDQVSVDTLS